VKDAIIYLDASSSMGLQNQIRQKLVNGILTGAFPPGMKLPSSRKLAQQLGIARNTVVGQTFRLGVGGLLALTWASLGVFNAVSSAIDHAWGVERRRSFLMHRLMSFLMMVSAGAVFILALILASLARVAETNGFWSLIARAPWLAWLSSVTANHGATVLLIVCVALLFYFIPNTEMRFRWVWPGAIVTGLLWRGALSAFSWYARDLAAWNAIHGSITTVVVFLFWVYISAVILLYGVEMTAAYARLQAAAFNRPELVKASA
jgi:membrane protein